MPQLTRDAKNPHTPTKDNDKGVELIQVIIDWYRSRLNCFTSAEATTIGNEVTNILNGTTKV